MDSKTTIGNLFNGFVQFSIPNYQRAYSWKVKHAEDQNDRQVNQFLDDIKEQDPGKPYYLGHFLLETIEEGRKYAVVDGQQRLTTLVIFMSSLISVCRKRGIDALGEYPLALIRDTYLEYMGRQKLTTVSEDIHYFTARVIQGNATANQETNRKAELNIREAADFFDQQLENADTATLAQWFATVNSAQITTFTLAGEDAQLAATQIFSLQNDRGKELTALEKLKAYLMHQIYKYEKQDYAVGIECINNYFSEIFARTEALRAPEDTILRWHCEAFLPSWEQPLLNIKKHIAECSSEQKLETILGFAASLRATFRKMVEIENAENNYSSYITDICYLDKENAMPLLIKLAHYSKLSLTGYDDVALKYLERILFKLTFSVGDYRTNSLISIAKNYSKDGYENLLETLKNCAEHGFQYYWDFTANCRRYFEDYYNHYTKELRYILYKYENFLRGEDTIPPLPIEECSNIFRKTAVQNTLDHITPVDPDFTRYSEDFKTRFLYNIGNLSLLTWSKNSAKNNHDPFLEKDKYDSVYLAQREIHDTLSSAKKWGVEEIAARRKKLLAFIFTNWEIGDPATIKELPR